jgi:S-methylmethionine-dependent homocysteine/selenocysteine methylase
MTGKILFTEQGDRMIGACCEEQPGLRVTFRRYPNIEAA